jgi:hypothetical protein
MLANHRTGTTRMRRLSIIAGTLLAAALPAHGQPAEDAALAVAVLQAEVALLKRENGQLKTRLANLETWMLAMNETMRTADRRLEISGNRQTGEILLRPAASFVRVAGQPVGTSIGLRETVVRAERIVLEGEEIVLKGSRAIRLNAPDISILGVRPPVVKGGSDITLKGTQIRSN